MCPTDSSTATKRPKSTTASMASTANIPAEAPTLLSILGLVCAFLVPTDLVRISTASSAVYNICSADEVWAPWVGRIASLARYGPSVLERIQIAIKNMGTGTLMAAYMGATQPLCPECGKWTGFLNLLTLKAQCSACYERAWKRYEYVMRSEAREVYALPEDVVKTLPSLYAGGNSPLVIRAQAEALALEHHGSLEALMEAKRARKRTVEAEYAYAKGMRDAKAKAAEARGLRAPPNTRKPLALTLPMTIEWGTEPEMNKCGLWCNPHRQVLLAVPFPAKDDPTVNSLTGEPADQDFTCQHCQTRAQWWDPSRPRFPTAAIRDEHQRTCPNRR